MGEVLMPQKRPTKSFSNLGIDLKEARKAMGMTRKQLAELVNIVPRYLANIENNGVLPSLPIFYELIRICRLPVERYFRDCIQECSAERERISTKLIQCPEKYLPIIESTIDGIFRMKETEKA